MLKSKFWRIVRTFLKSRVFWILAIFFSLVAYRFYVELQKVRSEQIQSWKISTSADCAVVLTGGSGRVREGFDLLANQRVKKLIVSGVFANARLREIMPVWPLYGDLSENDVVLDRRSETTYGNAQQSLPIVEALKCRDILLVTSKLHMYRAYSTFRATFPENIYIHRHAIIGGRGESSPWEQSVESMKSIFYATWAY